MTAIARAFGLTYSRELYLGAEGDDLRGEDKLTGRAGANFAIRFHLHPAVEPSLIEDGGGALLRLPSGAVWRLRVEPALISASPRASISARANHEDPADRAERHDRTQGASVRWAIRRERPAGEFRRDDSEPAHGDARPCSPRSVIGAGVLAAAGTGALVPLLRRAAVLDRPNARSSHTVPTPRGGGHRGDGAHAARLGWSLLAAGATPPDCRS